MLKLDSTVRLELTKLNTEEEENLRRLLLADDIEQITIGLTMNQGTLTFFKLAEFQILIRDEIRFWKASHNTKIRSEDITLNMRNLKSYDGVMSDLGISIIPLGIDISHYSMFEYTRQCMNLFERIFRAIVNSNLEK